MKLPTLEIWKKATIEMPLMEDGVSLPLLLRHSGEVKETVCHFVEAQKGWVFEAENEVLKTVDDVEWTLLEQNEDILNEMYDDMWDKYGFMLDTYGCKDGMYMITQCLDKLEVRGEVGNYKELIHMSYMKHLSLSA